MYLSKKIQDFTLVTPNTNSIIELEDIKEIIKETTTDNDTYIQRVILQTIVFVENQYLNFNILNTVYNLKLDNFSNFTLDNYCLIPKPADIYINKGFVNTINYIKYIDKDKTQQTLDQDAYALIQDHPFNFISSQPIGANFPKVYDNYNVVEIEFICGFGDTVASVPIDLIHALQKHIAFLVENRIPMCDVNANNTPEMSINTYNYYSRKNKFNVI